MTASRADPGARRGMHEALAAVRDALIDAAAVLQPVECAGCGAPDRGVCARCRADLVATPVPRVLDDGAIVVAGLRYGDRVRRLVLAGKEHGRGDALRALAPALGAAVRAALRAAGSRGAGPLEIAWVPSTAAARRRRGLDPVLVMLRAAGLPASRVLRARPGAPQKALDRASRVAAAAPRFAARGRLDGRRFLLVDDVVTTGATLTAAAAAIRLGGGRVLAMSSLATVTMRRETRDTGDDGGLSWPPQCDPIA